ncbi:transporter [Mesorhizobium sp.]|uniref:SphA family protein n=1 Tax=Mesorhizobium sp. TaxID=1871066 RepID=UPI000FE56B78|nr:transporter [Mesorhizobium sp.]RWQ27094.1 MAG: hypothetical protein EOS19_22050 [Mesorhizobium sp.]
MSRTALNLAILAAATAVGMSSVGSATATEGVAGRYIPGAYAGPGAGIVPPTPGVGYWAISNLYYHGEASGDVPFGNNTIALGLEADMWATVFAGVYVPELDLPGNWTYAVQAAIPVGWTRARATVGLAIDTTEEVTGLGDITVVPLLFGWHNDAMNTWFSAQLGITAPTGEWEEGALAFIGLNYWTFSPMVGFTYLVPEHGLDFSAKFGVDINTENPDTDYYSGAVAHLDVSVTKNLTPNFAIGAFAGFLYQTEDDGGAFADSHDGFKGRSIGIGPLISYKAKFGERTEIDFRLKWAHEIEVENRMKGDAVFFDITGKF